MMVYDRKTEIIQKVKNDFLYMGPCGTQDHRGPHKSPKNREKKWENGGNPKNSFFLGLGLPGGGWGSLEAK